MAKMNWIYEAPGDNVNKEEYLLGKKVDKYVDPSLQAAEREKHLLATTPGALFASASSNATVDLENKIREDPLFEIKKREQEAKKRLASNPVKLKQLRALVDEVKSSGGSNNSGKKKKKHKHKRKGSESSEDEARPKSKPEMTSRCAEDRHHHRVNDPKTDHGRRHRSRSPPHGEKRHRSPQRSSSSYKDRHSSYSSRRYHREEQETVSKRLSREELERKRQEMMNNAEWHAQKAGERMRKHRIEEEEEEIERQEHAGKEQEFVDPLMAETLADATAGTISDRIHRKIGSVQRTRAALEGNFTRK